MVKMNLEKLMPLYDAIEAICIEEYESTSYTKPHDLMEKLMDIPGMPMHCPPHHYMMPALLLTEAAKKFDISKDIFEEWLAESKDRALNVLGGFCGWFGNCGAAVGTGIFLSIFTNTNPHSTEGWADCQKITGTALLNISKVDGPRCCKRNSMIALGTAIDMIKDILNIDLEQTSDWKCKYYCNRYSFSYS